MIRNPSPATYFFFYNIISPEVPIKRMNSGARLPGIKSSSAMNHLWGKLLNFLRLHLFHRQPRNQLPLKVVNINECSNHVSFNCYYCYDTNDLCIQFSFQVGISFTLKCIQYFTDNICKFIDSLNTYQSRKNIIFLVTQRTKKHSQGFLLRKPALPTGRAHSSHHVMLPMGWSLRKETACDRGRTRPGFISGFYAFLVVWNQENYFVYWSGIFLFVFLKN